MQELITVEQQNNQRTYLPAHRMGIGIALLCIPHFLHSKSTISSTKNKLETYFFHVDIFLLTVFQHRILSFRFLLIFIYKGRQFTMDCICLTYRSDAVSFSSQLFQGKSRRPDCPQSRTEPCPSAVYHHRELKCIRAVLRCRRQPTYSGCHRDPPHSSSLPS